MLNLCLSNCSIFILTLCRLGGYRCSWSHAMIHTRSQSHTHKHTLYIRWNFARRAIGPSQRPLTDIHNSHKGQTSIPPGGIQTRNSSKRETVDPRLSPRGHWYRHIKSPFGKNVYLRATICSKCFQMVVEQKRAFSVIRKSLRNFRTRLRNNQDRHSREDISSTCRVGQKLGVPLPLLTCSPSAWPSRLLYRRGRKSRRDLWIILYFHGGEFIKINILSNHRVFRRTEIVQSV